ncbi:hypothetical protein [Mesorhizobium sp. M4A.F.Ca.ET.020.02.1.1]|uniref:hypothetical protein n=1 Tax=Mesorhizobium sp. M4A.F.Ca.ET.020.02.1.1 TaxID=2496652 RepID=UPI001FDEB971|nr:hypothetical protein [Mesorhizobium sp. M4A.F.Ca.ET.020.02.1.1]
MPFETFERDLRLATTGLQPAEINKRLAAFARGQLAEVIASGEGSKNYDRFVNGRQGAPEETVQVPGAILYAFNWWAEFIDTAKAELDRQAPRKTGRYARAFIVISGNKLVTDYHGIPSGAEVIITNFEPYVRRVEAQEKVFAAARSALSRRFGNSFRVEIRFLSIAAGVHPSIPYVLKGAYAARRNARRANPANFRGQQLPRRKDQEPGQPITYPALIINAIAA